MKKTIKALAQKILPASLYAQLTATSARLYIERVERGRGLDVLTKRYVAACGRTIADGPFKGMIYSPLADHRHVGARLLGTYEYEIAGAVEKCCSTDYEQVIDIGCAEGYYAVGFALRLPRARVKAFDTDSWARRACREVAVLNKVQDRVSVEGFCAADRLRSMVEGSRALVILDCEGYEQVMLNSDVVNALRQCDLIVELHDAPPTPEHPLVERFRATHEIELIPSVPRTVTGARDCGPITVDEQLQMMDEMRHAWQGWAIIRPK
ncbi:MAG: 50S ribosomal protein L11 methyltransferase [Chthoniobacterales bacterium]